MKIAMLTPWLVKCGISSYSYYLAHALAQQGCDVQVVRLMRFGVRDDKYFRHYAEEVPLDVDLIHIQHEYGLWDWQELAFYSALTQRLLMFDKKIPIVTTMHASGNVTTDPKIYAKSQAIIVHNRIGKRHFKLPCTIIPMGVQKIKKIPHPELCKKRWGVTGKTIGMFGFISAYKGLSVIIEATSKLQDVTLLVGGGWHINTQTPYILQMRNFASQIAPRRVRWLDYINEEDLPYYFGACDVMVFAHQMISESMSLNTALAYGKAVLTTNLEAFREKGEKNIIMTFDKIDDLIAKLKAFFTEPDLRKILEKNAKKHAEENSWMLVAEKHIKLYKSLLKHE